MGATTRSKEISRVYAAHVVSELFCLCDKERVQYVFTSGWRHFRSIMLLLSGQHLGLLRVIVEDNLMFLVHCCFVAQDRSYILFVKNVMCERLAGVCGARRVMHGQAGI